MVSLPYSLTGARAGYFSYLIEFAMDVFLMPLIWFDELLEASDMSGWFIGMVLVFIAYRYLIAPIFGSSHGRGSDSASKKRHSSDDT